MYNYFFNIYIIGYIHIYIYTFIIYIYYKYVLGPAQSLVHSFFLQKSSLFFAKRHVVQEIILQFFGVYRFDVNYASLVLSSRNCRLTVSPETRTGTMFESSKIHCYSGNGQDPYYIYIYIKSILR